MTTIDNAALKIIVKDAIRNELKRVKAIGISNSNRHVSRVLGIAQSTLSSLADGKDVSISDGLAVRIAEILEITWKCVKTQVYTDIEQDVMQCKKFAGALMLIEGCGIGKTYCSKQIQRNVENCYYIDASQCKTKVQFAKALANEVGVNLKKKDPEKGEHRSYDAIKSIVKETLRSRANQVVIIDEAGDLNYEAFCDIKEYYNATKNICGWYIMGADGLHTKMERGLKYHKQSFKEMFSRCSGTYGNIISQEENVKLGVYREQAMMILRANYKNSGALVRMSEIKRTITDQIGQAGFASGFRIVEGALRAAQEI